MGPDPNVEGIDDLSDEEFSRVVESIDGAAFAEHFILFRLPEPAEGSGSAHANLGATSVADAYATALKDGPLAAAVLIEAQALAQEIVAAAPRAIVTYTFTEGRAS